MKIIVLITTIVLIPFFSYATEKNVFPLRKIANSEQCESCEISLKKSYALEKEIQLSSLEADPINSKTIDQQLNVVNKGISILGEFLKKNKLENDLSIDVFIQIWSTFVAFDLTGHKTGLEFRKYWKPKNKKIKARIKKLMMNVEEQHKVSLDNILLSMEAVENYYNQNDSPPK